MATDYIWPVSNSATPDEMNTSFGPRINNNKWDFHDGIDRPAPIGTPVHAMRAGTVHLAGPRDDRFSSRHVVLKVDDPKDGLMYLVYLHLASPTSATRAKKASNLLILRSWGRKGRHHKVMFWLGHEGGVGGDLGG
jgi:hypothetical protein